MCGIIAMLQFSVSSSAGLLLEKMNRIINRCGGGDILLRTAMLVAKDVSVEFFLHHPISSTLTDLELSYRMRPRGIILHGQVSG
jgi:hypothetical protein